MLNRDQIFSNQYFAFKFQVKKLLYLLLSAFLYTARLLQKQYKWH